MPIGKVTKHQRKEERAKLGRLQDLIVKEGNLKKYHEHFNKFHNWAHQPMNFPCVMLQIWMAHPIYGSNGAPLHAIKLEIGQNLDQTRATNTGGPIGCPSCCRLCWLVLGMERSSLGSRDSYCLRFLFYVHRKFSPCERQDVEFFQASTSLGWPVWL